ncbi:uncharacterized protein LOC111089875 [Limulus polyphemus]|uniref:Uncharacterized protein LOC111089875 n=1 Tax=Limulus polyphemus TaxID=6850 RepID=A0ABM1TSG3_LIMPO|nr:uncharacterized protein LOC111089875 [Limulus polyphemus]
MRCCTDCVTISAIFTIVESLWGLTWTIWSLLMLKNPELFLNGTTAQTTVGRLAKSFDVLEPLGVDFSLVIFEAILNVFWIVCGFVLLCGYKLRKQIVYVIPWTVVTLFVILYDVSVTMYYIYRLVCKAAQGVISAVPTAVIKPRILTL